ncbi:deSI-like protein [Tanacetum coccineum]
MSKLLARPNVKLFNAVAAEDLIIKGGRVGGVVTNWALVAINHDTQSCMDPNVMEAKTVATLRADGLWESVNLPRIEMINMVLIDFITSTMKFAPMKGFKSIVPLRSKGKSADRFCLFPKVKDDYGPGNTHVYLNVYNLTPMNGYAYWVGFGIFHSGVEAVYGVEYAFGAHDYPTSDVFEVEPKQCPGFKFRKSILIGITSLDHNAIISTTTSARS